MRFRFFFFADFTTICVALLIITHFIIIVYTSSCKTLLWSLQLCYKQTLLADRDQSYTLIQEEIACIYMFVVALTICRIEYKFALINIRPEWIQLHSCVYVKIQIILCFDGYWSGAWYKRAGDNRFKGAEPVATFLKVLHLLHIKQRAVAMCC